MDDRELLLRLFDRLREEIVAMQKVRAQLHVFKVSAVGLTYYASAYSAANNAPGQGTVALLLAPFVAGALDLFIEGHSLAIKEIGFYIRKYIEPVLFDPDQFKTRLDEFIPYENFLVRPHGKVPGFRGLANRVMTILSSGVSAVLLLPFEFNIAGSLRMPSWGYYLIWLALTAFFNWFAFWKYKVPQEWLQVPEVQYKVKKTARRKKSS